MATQDGTWRYRNRYFERYGRAYFRRFGDQTVTSIGVGTYLGDATDTVDDAYHDAIVTALESGCNVVDTAINYRNQRSERVVGKALADADVERDEILISTKGGFVPFDGDRPENPGAYVKSEYVDSGIVASDELAHGSHCISPAYIDDQLDRSLSNLDLDTIDLYYVHNPETQLDVRSPEDVYDQLEAAFTRLEERAANGDINHYGVATWDAFRVPKSHDHYLSIVEVVSRARKAARAAGNTATHFRAIQLPFNVRMADAFTVESHDGPDGPQSALWFAREAGLNVFTSASLLQGKLATDLPEAVAAQLPGETTAQRSLNFARSGPGVTCSLVGMSSPAHVEENLKAGEGDAMGARAFDAIFE
ncbi:aldo/keto reductase [Haladaptatus sp. DJG-WS-42]|uniref:aldo/keto reductase n=1 Tax=Haladaptatus sp. DJG-WS-42 TaxID=3120516 RepID=UPI0030CFC618